MLQSVAVEENDGRVFPAYDTILNAINVALCDELSAGESVIFSTRYGKDIVALKTTEGTIVPFTTLSDGYRNIIKIVLEIAEPDLSLHPTWQKRIVGILKTLFPKIQFICATHSPFIIQSLEEGELFTLDKEDFKPDEEYSGESIEDIAEGIMGVEMPQYSEKKIEMYEAAKEYFEALKTCTSKEQIEVLRQEMVRLEAEYDDNPALAYTYQGGIPKVNETALNHVDPTGERLTKAKNLFALVDLGNVPAPWVKDRRFHQRNKAYELAVEALTDWQLAKTCTSEGKDVIKRLIVLNAQGYGFFSVWMTVFVDEPDICKALLDAFPGTNHIYFDETYYPKCI